MPYKDPEKRREYDRLRNKTLERKMARKSARVFDEKQRAKNREYYLKNRDKFLQKAKEHAERNRAHIKIYRRAYKNSHKAFLANITNEEYDEITSACAVCGFTEIVDIHHKDGDHTNNCRENLIGLCPNHHFLIHRRNVKLDDLLSIHLPFEENGEDALAIWGFRITGNFNDPEKFEAKILNAYRVRKYARDTLNDEVKT